MSNVWLEQLGSVLRPCQFVFGNPKISSTQKEERKQTVVLLPFCNPNITGLQIIIKKALRAFKDTSKQTSDAICVSG